MTTPAHRYSWRISSAVLSAENVENVVSPPRNPVVISSRISGDRRLEVLDVAEHEADQVSADEIRDQRAERQHRQDRVQRHAQPPTQPRA